VVCYFPTLRYASTPSATFLPKPIARTTSDAPLQIAHRQVFAGFHPRLEHHALPSHLLEPPIENVLLELEFGYPISEDPAYAAGLLENL